MHSRSVSVCGPFSASFLKAVSIAARCSGVTFSCHSFGIGGMPVIWCVDVISHRPGLTSSLSAATASGVTQQHPNRTMGMRRRVFIERPPGCLFVATVLHGLWRKSSRNAAGACGVPYFVATRKLSTYRKKRDFTKTAEPSGKLPVKSSEQLRFVIQKHAARRLHYDLRLELDGVFKSWAVTRGPSLTPQDKRLAVEVEDHPLDYGDFEGTIPQGQYGGGTVQLWDRGYWSPIGDLSAEEQLRKGELKFLLAGERLKGSWVMVRMKNDRDGGKRTNWLLIKHRDEFARDAAATAKLIDEDASVASGRTMGDIAAGKGRAPKPFMLDSRKLARADAVWQSKESEPIAEVAKPAAKPKRSSARKSASVPDFIEPELCKLVERPPSGDEWAHEA